MEQPSSSDAVAIAQRLVDALGVEAVAHMLDVNTDRLDLWVTGQVPPSDEDRAKLANLDSLVSHLLNVFTPAQARLWLKARTRTLARALSTCTGSKVRARVIVAIRAHAQGAFA
jgi:hypothetical protein